MSRAKQRMADNVEWVIRTDHADAPKFYGGPLQAWRSKGTEVMLAGQYEAGKDQPLAATVYTPAGPKKMGDIRLGDLVLAGDGTPTIVTGVYPQGVRPVYRMVLDDGAEVLAGEDHLWLVAKKNHVRYSASVDPARKRIRGSSYDDWRVMTTRELAGKSLRKQVGSKKETRRKYWLPLAGAAQFTRKDLPIDPYVMGVLIAEGSMTSTGVKFSTSDDEMLAEMQRRLPDAEIVHVTNYDYGIAGGAYRERLRDLELLGCLSADKFIPPVYLYSCVEDRVALLRGLMDGDGTICDKGHVTYTSVSQRLIEDLTLLVESLGGRVSSVGEKPGSYTKGGTRIYTGSTGYTAHISLPVGFNPFHLSRKGARVGVQSDPRRFIDRIEYVGEMPTQCISVAHPSHLYLTDRFIVTHNTFAALYKMHNLALKYPGCRILLARKLYSSLVSTALVTYYRKVLPYPPEHPLCPVVVFGGSRPETISYPNGSVMVVAGLDNADKVLSAEYDFVYVNQAEELTLHDWEQILSRTTGRAGNAPYSQVLGDCNPGAPTHWILHRPSLELYTATHQDNPVLYDHEKEEWTDQGRRTISILSTMTGLRYKRGFLGLWAGAEGQIYETFDEQTHIVDPFPIPDSWRRWRVIDFGYTHPFSCQWWAQDHKGTLYMYREIYMSGRIVDEHVNGMNGMPGILQLSAGERYEATICDHDAEDRATLEKYGIKTKKADKSIRQGIEAVQMRLRVDADGNSGLYFFRDALVEEDEMLRIRYKPLSVVGEFGGYAWPSFDARRREASPRDEVPIRADDHGLDCLRYIVMEVDGRKKLGQAKVIAYA